TLAEIEGLDELENLRDSEPARGGRTHAADFIAPVGDAEGCTLFGGVAGEIGEAHVPLMVGSAAHGSDDRFGNWALVEGLAAAFSDGAQACRELGVLEQVVDGPGVAGPVEEVSSRRWRKAVGALPGQQEVQAWGDAKSVGGKLDGRPKKAPP